MSSPVLRSQVLVAGAACVLAIAVAYVLHIQSSEKTRKQKKKQPQVPRKEELQQQQQQPEQHRKNTECEETHCSHSECSSVASESLDQQEMERVNLSAIAAPDAGGDDLRLDSGIGSPKGTPSLENRSNSEQLVEQASDLIQESFSEVYSKTNGIDSSSLFVETSVLSIVEPDTPIQETPVRQTLQETLPEVTTPDIKTVVSDICEITVKNEMTEEVPEPVATSPDCPTNANGPSAAENDDSVKQLDFSPEPSPVREIKKTIAKKDSSPAREKVSRRKAAVRSKDHSNKEQMDPNPAPVKGRNSDDRNNNNNNNSNARRQSTESDVVTDSKSEGSADSSKAGSDSCPSSVTSQLLRFKHEFELPTDLCGRLIGRLGSNVKDIRDKTGAIVTVRPHPVELGLKQVYVVAKAEESIKLALAEIRKKFPLKLYPHLTLSTVDRQGLAGLAGALPPSYLTLPEDQDTVVTVTALDGCNHLYLQSPNNQTFELFLQLDMKMRAAHSAPNAEPPALPENLVRPNAICVITDGNGWYRVAIERVISRDEVRVKYVDFGGHDIVPQNKLRQIRSDFIYIPFQAIEVLLADMEPIDPEGRWSNESIEAIRTHADETNNMVLARVVGYSGSVPCVQLTCIARETGERFSLSEQLIFEGHAKCATDSNRSSPNANGSEGGSEGPTFSPADFPQLGATQQTC